MTIEIIVFIAAILFGIVWYVRESKSNKLYRFFNKLMHAKDLQMKADNKKGFVHEQPFLMRLVWVTVLFVLAAVIVTFVTPINGFYIQYFASAIVGTLIGTYVASMFFVASEELTKENIMKKAEEAYQKGKDFVEDLKGEEEPVEETEEAPKTETTETDEPETKKSARDRLKDKGMIK
ncbi:hypothetical protein POV27_16550 [Aureisphaera galaxeae]|uniref:hypothetical protein n=1 Tax=Aureisphaera galaxeae TaxID=1538023 RepID=UPI00234FE0A0|nr:hypothetical protein [Aureisphaera galaxeae]MDC8005670.1 hypothetical protein [Aureisphaera galaxeae]